MVIFDLTLTTSSVDVAFNAQSYPFHTVLVQSSLEHVYGCGIDDVLWQTVPNVDNTTPCPNVVTYRYVNCTDAHISVSTTPNKQSRLS